MKENVKTRANQIEIYSNQKIKLNMQQIIEQAQHNQHAREQ